MRQREWDFISTLQRFKLSINSGGKRRHRDLRGGDAEKTNFTTLSLPNLTSLTFLTPIAQNESASWRAAVVRLAATEPPRDVLRSAARIVGLPWATQRGVIGVQAKQTALDYTAEWAPSEEEADELYGKPNREGRSRGFGSTEH